MSIPRVIPSMLLIDGLAYKSRKFKDHKYIGEPSNIIKIFNDKEIDELIVLDRSAHEKGLDLEVLSSISSQSFFPLCYGGGLDSIKKVEEVISLGFEKVIFNTVFYENPKLISSAVSKFGSSAVSICLDYSNNIFGRQVYKNNSSKKVPINLEDCVSLAIELGAGEIVFNNVSKDGMLTDLDISIVKEFGTKLPVPFVISGGASSEEDIIYAIKSGASGVAVGEFFVHVPPHRAVLIRYLSQEARAIIEGLD